MRSCWWLEGAGKSMTGKGPWGMENLQMEDLEEREDLGEGLFRSTFRAPEELRPAQELGTGESIILLEGTEGAYLSCPEEGSALGACLRMTLARFGPLPETGEKRTLTEDLSISETELLLSAAGMEATYCQDGDIERLLDAVENQEGVICLISRMALYVPELSDLPGCCDCSAVNVVGFDFQDPFSVRVILDDPSAGKGGMAWDLSDFLRAWQQGGNASLIVRRRNLI